MKKNPEKKFKQKNKIMLILLYSKIVHNIPLHYIFITTNVSHHIGYSVCFTPVKIM